MPDLEVAGVVIVMSVREQVSPAVLVSGSRRRKARISLGLVYSIIFALEFLGVALAAYFADAFYHYSIYSHFDKADSVVPALFLSTLVVTISLAFRQFVAI